MYPKLTLKLKKLSDTEIDPETLVPVKEIGDFLTKRTGGDFFGRAFYLVPDYDWFLGLDGSGSITLVPTRRK